MIEQQEVYTIEIPALDGNFELAAEIAVSEANRRYNVEAGDDWVQLSESSAIITLDPTTLAPLYPLATNQ